MHGALELSVIAKSLIKEGHDLGTRALLVRAESRFAGADGNSVLNGPGNCFRKPNVFRNIDYLRDHLRELMKAVCEDGVNCVGYTMWAPIDLVSLSTGEMKKRYGFIFVDMDDRGNGSLARRKKRSWDWMRQVIAANGENLWDTEGTTN